MNMSRDVTRASPLVEKLGLRPTALVAPTADSREKIGFFTPYHLDLVGELYILLTKSASASSRQNGPWNVSNGVFQFSVDEDGHLRQC
jgi:hypothetical protein